ncbi:glycosyltransferase family 2 protein [Rhodococcus aerolatus]
MTAPVRGNAWDALDGLVPAAPPTVSVVVPWYRDQARLDLVLTGLALQSHPATRLQVVVADDGSPHPPDTGALGRDAVVVRQDDRGFRAGAARTLGAAAADGDVLCFLDADTVPEPGYVTALARLPALCPDAVVVGRRRHADLAGWTPDRLRGWLTAGAPAPAELAEPGWLRDGLAHGLLDADDRAYRYVISAVLGCPAALFAELGGFDPSFVGYGGEDWEWAHRAWHAGAVLAHVPGAVAWHDGPDWAGRSDDPLRARRDKNAETLALARLVPHPASRGTGQVHRVPDLVVTVDVPADRTTAGLLAVRSVLAGGTDARVWLRGGGAPALAELWPDDPRVQAGEPPPDALARARHRLHLTGPVVLRAGALAALRARLDDVGRVRAGALTLTTSRALGRAHRHPGAAGDVVAELFGAVELDPAEAGVLPVDPEPDLDAVFGGWA